MSKMQPGVMLVRGSSRGRGSEWFSYWKTRNCTRDYSFKAPMYQAVGKSRAMPSMKPIVNPWGTQKKGKKRNEAPTTP